MELNTEQLVTYNPKLAKYTPTTRIAYAKFKNVIQSKHPFIEEEETGTYLIVMRNLLTESNNQFRNYESKVRFILFVNVFFYEKIWLVRKFVVSELVVGYFSSFY